ncbi:MAG: hypothetical protein MJ016_00950 [Victivallaceae bacterium]|nr:hypothetical protein [Victivallaceae bacterium]
MKTVCPFCGAEYEFPKSDVGARKQCEFCGFGFPVKARKRKLFSITSIFAGLFFFFGVTTTIGRAVAEQRYYDEYDYSGSSYAQKYNDERWESYQEYMNRSEIIAILCFFASATLFGLCRIAEAVEK